MLSSFFQQVFIGGYARILSISDNAIGQNVSLLCIKIALGTEIFMIQQMYRPYTSFSFSFLYIEHGY